MTDYYDGGPRMSLQHSLAGALVGGVIGAILIGHQAIVSFGATGAIIGAIMPLLVEPRDAKVRPRWGVEKASAMNYAYPTWMMIGFPVALLLMLAGIASILLISFAGFSIALLVGAYLLPAGLTIAYLVISEAEKTHFE